MVKPPRPHTMISRDRGAVYSGLVTYECAFCGEENEVLVDTGGGRRQTFTEDCAVCCQPIQVTASVEDDEAYVQVARLED